MTTLDPTLPQTPTVVESQFVTGVRLAVIDVNKDPQTNIDRVYVSRLHISSRLSVPLKAELRKTGRVSNGEC